MSLCCYGFAIATIVCNYEHVKSTQLVQDGVLKEIRRSVL